jgi:hypothetical protein
VLTTLLLASCLAADGGEEDRVRLQAAVVVASTQGRDVAKMLVPLERHLRTLLPYTSYKGFTEYTASVAPGEALDLRLPDGRSAHLVPKRVEEAAPGPHPPRPIHVAIDRGEEFESKAACGGVTVFQIKNGTADHAGDRTFLVFEETCPGDHPARVLQ